MLNTYNEIIDILDKIKFKVKEGEPLDTCLFVRKIQNKLKPYLKRNLNPDFDLMYVFDIEEHEDIKLFEYGFAGFYGGSEIELVFYKSITNSIIFSKKEWETTKRYIAETICHEYTHYQQDIKRGYENQREPKQKEISELEEFPYLSKPDEVDAYSMSSFLQLMRISTDKKNAEYNLKHINTSIEDLQKYIDVFSKSSIVYKRIVKKIYKHIQNY